MNVQNYMGLDVCLTEPLKSNYDATHVKKAANTSAYQMGEDGAAALSGLSQPGGADKHG